MPPGTVVDFKPHEADSMRTYTGVDSRDAIARHECRAFIRRHDPGGEDRVSDRVEARTGGRQARFLRTPHGDPSRSGELG